MKANDIDLRGLCREIGNEALAALATRDPKVMAKALDNIHAMSRYEVDVVPVCDRVRGKKVGA